MAVMSWPPIMTRPEVGSTSRLMQRRSVDLPDPLGPMTETNAPFATSSVTESRPLFPPGKTLVRPSTLTRERPARARPRGPTGWLRALLRTRRGLEHVGPDLLDDLADRVVVRVLCGHQRVDGVQRLESVLYGRVAAHRDHRVLQLLLLRRVEIVADHLRVSGDRGVGGGDDFGLGHDAGAGCIDPLVVASVIVDRARVDSSLADIDRGLGLAGDAGPLDVVVGVEPGLFHDVARSEVAGA